MEISYKKLKFFAVLYAALPIAVFFIGWLNALSAFLFTAMLAAGVYFFYKNLSDEDGEYKSITVSKKALIAVAVIAFIWCILAGQGSFVHQSDDHVMRNAINYDLITKPWPVTYNNGNTMLSYYIAYWMVPSLMGKIVYAVSGSAFAGYLAGNIFLLLWSALGCAITFLLVATVTNTGNRQRIFIAILIFIFFSGLDVVGSLINKSTTAIYSTQHLEWWAGHFQYSSNSTCLFWVYNQTIVPWILTLCIINEKRIHNLAVFGILAFPYGPFPFVGIVILCILKTIAIAVPDIKKKKFIKLVKDVFSLQNILFMVSIATIFILYYKSNLIVAQSTSSAGAAASAASGGASHGIISSFLTKIIHRSGGSFGINTVLPQYFASHNTPEIKRFFSSYVKFIILEFGVYLFFIFKRKKPDLVFTGMVVSLVIIPFFQMGYSADFAMRVSIPALVYVCIMFTRVVLAEIPDWGEYADFYEFARKKKFLIAALIVFMLGTFTSTMEFRREIVKTFATPYSKIADFKTERSLEKHGLPQNFTASNYKQSDFYKYVCKKAKKE